MQFYKVLFMSICTLHRRNNPLLPYVESLYTYVDRFVPHTKCKRVGFFLMRKGYNYHRAHIGFNRSHINIGIVNLKMYKIRPFSIYIQIPLEFMFTSFIGVSSYYFVVRSNLKLDIWEHEFHRFSQIKTSFED